AALYKCLGGFATNGINLTRLESRPVRGGHWHYHFYLDFQGHPDTPASRQALDELRFFTEQVKMLGCYAAADDGVRLSPHPPAPSPTGGEGEHEKDDGTN
ncbi:MAG: hypothetical protein HQL60_07390, partial [Magnetococcales bacterium]|nr:hypothetical protein [Magnetococcales bacterium]